MSNIVVPELGESIVEARVVKWLKHEGEPVQVGEPVVELETDKVDLEVGATQAGVLARIDRRDGADVKVGDVLGVVEAAAAQERRPAPPAPAQPPPAAPADTARQVAPPPEVIGEPRPEPPPPAPVQPGERREERVRLSRRRQTIAKRLVEAQRTAAMLTTFNEIDMSEVSAIRLRHKERFRQRVGVGLGITSFFVRAVCTALKEFPHLNAEIEGDEMVLKYYYDIGVAVGTTEGLVVPVLRNADRLSFGGIEQQIKEFARKAEAGQLTLEDLRGGTFTITNGGIFGSLMSTPILNPPQVGILGLHKIEDRAVPVAGRVEIRPMMYVALSYDHRLVDGMEAVRFLVRIKELVEDPNALLLEA